MKRQKDDGRSHPLSLFHYIQCDDRLHRVGRIPPPHGIDVYVGKSQLLLLYFSSFAHNNSIIYLQQSLTYGKHKRKVIFISYLPGSQWIMLSQSFVRYVATNEKVKPFINYFKRYRIPDEVFVQTVLKTSNFCHTQIHDDTHFFRWEKNVAVNDTSKCISPNKKSCGRSARGTSLFRSNGFHTEPRPRILPIPFISFVPS